MSVDHVQPSREKAEEDARGAHRGWAGARDLSIRAALVGLWALGPLGPLAHGENEPMSRPCTHSGHAFAPSDTRGFSVSLLRVKSPVGSFVFFSTGRVWFVAEQIQSLLKKPY